MHTDDKKVRIRCLRRELGASRPEAGGKKVRICCLKNIYQPLRHMLLAKR